MVARGGPAKLLTLTMAKENIVSLDVNLRQLYAFRVICEVKRHALAVPTRNSSDAVIRDSSRSCFA